jgi:F-type H+-transporting ATPase subunit b
MMRKETPRHILATLFVAAAPALAFASEAGGEGYDWAGFGWQLVNFAILATLLVVFVRKPLRDYLKARTESIKKSIEEARQARELAEKALAEVHERLKVKDREIAEVVAAAETSGQKEKEALIEEGERLAQKLIEQARSNIDYELKQAREAIKAEAVELAMELAEKKIKDKLGEEEQKKLFEDALQRLERRS